MTPFDKLKQRTEADLLSRLIPSDREIDLNDLLNDVSDADIDSEWDTVSPYLTPDTIVHLLANYASTELDIDGIFNARYDVMVTGLQDLILYCFEKDVQGDISDELFSLEKEGVSSLSTSKTKKSKRTSLFGVKLFKVYHDTGFVVKFR